MDPVTVLGIAAAAVEFFTIAVKAVQQGRQIYASKTGATEANEALEQSLRTISNIRGDLRSKTVRDTESNIYKTQQKCLTIADKLLNVLEGVKASSQTAKSRSLRNALATWRVMKAGKKISKLEKGLSVAQRHFAEALTVDARNEIAQILENQGKDSSMVHAIWNEFQQLRAENKAAHGEMLAGLAQIEKTSAAQDASNQYSHQASHQLIKNLDTNMQTQFGGIRITDANREILQSLQFPDMLHRQQTIDPPAEGTFEWVFTGESPYQKQPAKYKDLRDIDLDRRGRLLRWFSSDEPLFWINGKPGSGKSSLMCYLANDDRTMKALESRSSEHTVHIVKFFFWRTGSPLQRSISGLLRSLLYQIFMLDSNMIDKLIAQGSMKRHPTWEQVELLRTLKAALDQQDKPYMCLFIDGLDEHDGDYMSLLDLVLQMQAAPNVKICLSSRPEPAFQLRLNVCPTISMQDINMVDIERLVRLKLEPGGIEVSTLIDNVTQRAEGVFLWAALVCNSLVTGYTKDDDKATLQKRLDEIPSGLRNLFADIFSKIDKVHREYLRFYCHFLKLCAAGGFVRAKSVDFIAACLHQPAIQSLDHFLELCARCERRIVEQSQGLIEITTARKSSPAIDVWSVREFADQAIPHSQSHMERNRAITMFGRSYIRWVHRTAHDCIFGEHGESIAPWILSTNVGEMDQKILRGYRWFGEHAPTIRVEEVNGQVALGSGDLYDIGRDIPRLTAHNSHEGLRVLEELQDLISSAFTGDKRSDCRSTLR